jgi:uncharacterized membrane-anchored protein YjiN (DUF445 family)
MKRRATGLLLFMAVVFVVVTAVGHGRGWSGWLQAGVEASLVGGLADWFAVTALFRHPLGLPIPHTAVIPDRKDQFGQTLGEFVQQNFLSPEIIASRARSAQIAKRLSDWLADRQNAEALAAHLGDLPVGLADVIRDEDVHPLLEGELRRAIDSVPVAPTAGRVLRMVTADGRHQQLFDSVVAGLAKFLDDHQTAVRDRFKKETPWWLPDAVDDRIFDRIYDGVRRVVGDIGDNPDHELRAQFNQWLASLSERLEHDPDMRARGEQLKQDLLSHGELREWTASLWGDAKTALRQQAGDPDSALRTRLADAIVAIGKRMGDDPALLGKLEDLLENGACYIAEHFHEEISGLVSGTIARWDGHETSRKLELLLGRDLQYIRINGTVVGGLAGLAIHAIARWIS